MTHTISMGSGSILLTCDCEAGLDCVAVTSGTAGLASAQTHHTVFMHMNSIVAQYGYSTLCQTKYYNIDITQK